MAFGNGVGRGKQDIIKRGINSAIQRGNGRPLRRLVERKLSSRNSAPVEEFSYCQEFNKEYTNTGNNTDCAILISSFNIRHPIP